MKKKTKKTKKTIKKHSSKLMIHQIYGLFGDNKPMNELFKESNKKWKTLAKKNGYRYKLWNMKACDNLINQFPQFKKMYNSVRYPIMKADIMRFLILYKHGGLYSDLDVLPLKNKYSFDKLSFCIYYYTPLDKQHVKNFKPDMEMIYSPKGNEWLLNYIYHIGKQIKAKSKVKIYEQWKVRYIFQTTGPKSLKRYMDDNKVDFDHIRVMGMDKKYSFKDKLSDIVSPKISKQNDAISFYSCSYGCDN